MEERRGRPAIPQAIQRELWARAAGRCQFRGCNILLYKDDLTQQQSNLGVISHIVSFSPSGPRGDLIRSKLLEKDIHNLMLTCSKHGKLIDDKALEEAYPEELLVTFKREHETRVRRATEGTEDAQTHVLLLQIPIDGQDVYINPADAHRAIQPKYPAEESPVVIDLSGTKLPAEGEGFFTLMAQSITQQIQAILARRAGASRINSLSVFALAPIPLLIHTGHCLGDIQCLELYQRHRDQQNWRWKEDEEAQAFYEIIKPEGDTDRERPIALVFSISGLMSLEHVARSLGCDPLIYEIRAREPSRDFLRSRKRLELFSYEVRNMLIALRDAHYWRKPVHVFAALPAPMAIEFGRNIKSLDTPFIIYEYQNSQHAFVPALRINAV
jgi:SMODS-associated and fused to various effectors sensor domain